MPAKLVLVHGEPHVEKPSEVLLDDSRKTSWSIGRHGDVPFASKIDRHKSMISRKHAVISFNPAVDQLVASQSVHTGWRIEDKGSLNGLLLNAVRIAESGLQSGDELAFGQSHTVKFEGVHPNPDDVEFRYRFEITENYSLLTEIEKVTTGRAKRPREEAPEENMKESTVADSHCTVQDHCTVPEGNERAFEPTAVEVVPESSAGSMVVEALAEDQVEDELTCSICRELIAGGHVLPGCGHVHCYPCVTSWLASSPQSSCPDCRKPVVALPTPVPWLDKICQSLAQQLYDQSQLAEWRQRCELSKEAARAADATQSAEPVASERSEEVHNALRAAAVVSRKPLGRPDVPKPPKPPPRFIVGYTEGRSSCSRCKVLFDGGALRVGENQKHPRLGFSRVVWRHLACCTGASAITTEQFDNIDLEHLRQSDATLVRQVLTSHT